jgi:hypothetical protein
MRLGVMLCVLILLLLPGGVFAQSERSVGDYSQSLHEYFSRKGEGEKKYLSDYFARAGMIFDTAVDMIASIATTSGRMTRQLAGVASSEAVSFFRGVSITDVKHSLSSVRTYTAPRNEEHQNR